MRRASRSVRQIARPEKQPERDHGERHVMVGTADVTFERAPVGRRRFAQPVSDGCAVTTGKLFDRYRLVPGNLQWISAKCLINIYAFPTQIETKLSFRPLSLTPPSRDWARALAAYKRAVAAAPSVSEHDSSRRKLVHADAEVCSRSPRGDRPERPRRAGPAGGRAVSPLGRVAGGPGT